MTHKETILYLTFEEQLKQSINISIKSKKIITAYFTQSQHELFGILHQQNRYYTIPKSIEMITLIFFDGKRQKLFLKIPLLGQSCVGKGSLMRQYSQNIYHDDNDHDWRLLNDKSFMNHTVNMKYFDVNISASHVAQFENDDFDIIISSICSDAKVILFCFDSSYKMTLFSIKRWYKLARKVNTKFTPFLIGTKYDLYLELPLKEQKDITKKARKYAKKMGGAPLIYCSSQNNINVSIVFQMVIERVFNLKSTIIENHKYKNNAMIQIKRKKKDRKNKHKQNQETL